MFQSDYPAALRRLDRAVKSGDSEALRLAAHALKGVLATVGSPAGRDAAMALEQMGRSGNVGAAKDLAASLRETIAALNAALASAGLSSASPPKARAATRRPATKNRRVHDKDSRRRR
jgi:HPt (histidine-containing phosphotransfer) domain-containing protein